MDAMKPMLENLDFGRALFWLRGGFRVRRAAWREGQYLILREAGGEQWLSSRYDGHSEHFPYISGSTDLLAEDWELLG